MAARTQDRLTSFSFESAVGVLPGFEPWLKTCAGVERCQKGYCLMSARKISMPEQRVAILWEHLIETVPVSQVWDEHGTSVVNFYNWQEVFFENGEAAFERKPNSANVKRQEDANLAKIQVLEAKLRQKNEVSAQLLQEHIKPMGPPETQVGIRGNTRSGRRLRAQTTGGHPANNRGPSNCCDSSQIISKR